MLTFDQKFKEEKNKEYLYLKNEEEVIELINDTLDLKQKPEKTELKGY